MHNRLRKRRLAAASIVVAFALAGAVRPALAQIRRIPPGARAGRFSITSFPQALLDRKPVVLAPGVRILSTDNLLVVPSTLSGADEQIVRYRLDPLNQVIEVWLLTPAEAQAAARDTGSAS
jgi:hypothetical protein